MCWDNNTTEPVIPSDVWEKGYAIKFWDSTNNRLSDLWAHEIDCYDLHTILRADEVAIDARIGRISSEEHYESFGFNIFPNKKSAEAYLKEEWYRGCHVLVECWYRYVDKICKTHYGDCVAAQEMIINYIYPRARSLV